MVEVSFDRRRHREGGTMNDRETLFLLSSARQNIGQAVVHVQRIARYDPGIARVELPRLRRLAARQLRLERKAGIRQGPDLGWILPVVMGGMALLGIGGYVFKHHEETSLERYKLESIDNCISENVAAGMERGEAARICSQLFSGRDLAGVFAELSKTILMASLAITAVYIVLRWKK